MALFSVICFLLSVRATLVLSDGQVPGCSGIGSRSFVLRTSLKVALHEGPTHLYHVEEAYSRWQRRARIHYAALGLLSRQQTAYNLPREAAIYLDNKQALLHNRTLGQCRPVSHDDLLNFFQLDAIKRAIYSGDGGDGDGAQAEAYLGGPARLLVFLDRMRDRFVDSKDIGRTRNIESTYYEFNYTTGEYPYDNDNNNNIWFAVHYSLAQLEQQRRRRDALMIPIRVLMRNNQVKDVLFDFTLRELLPDAGGQDAHLLFRPAAAAESSLDDNDAAADQEPALDEFAIQPAIGCSDQILARVDPFARGEGGESFSFESEIEYTNRWGTKTRAEILVAYERSLDSLKVTSRGLTRSSTILTNFLQARTYHMLENRLRGHRYQHDPILGRFLDLDAPAGGGGSSGAGDDDDDDPLAAPASSARVQSCVVFKAHTGPQRECPYGLGELIAGSSDFVHLGEARVRGVWTQVYESNHSGSPVWLEQPVLYTNIHTGVEELRSTGAERRRGPQAEAAAAPASSSSSEYVTYTIVYMNEHDPDNKYPMLVDVRRLAARDLSLELSRNKIELYNFEWRVNTNRIYGAAGRPQEQNMFTLADHCPTTTATAAGDSDLANDDDDDNHYGQLEMHLLSADAGFSPAELDRGGRFDWLRAAPKRNLALLGSLQSAFGLPATMVYDLESQLATTTARDNTTTTTTTSRLELRLKFRLAKHQSQLVRVTYYGRGLARRSLLELQAPTFQSCLNIVAHRRRPTFFGYNPDREACSVDLTEGAPIRGQPNPFEVEAFEFHPADSTFVYLVSHREDLTRRADADDEITQFARGQKQQRYLIEARELPLAGGGGHPATTLNFRIESVGIRELHQKQAYDIEGLGRLHTTNKFLGFGLIEFDVQNTRIEPERLNLAPHWAAGAAPDAATGDSRAQAPGRLVDTAMSFGQCQAACLAEPTCRSFSVCVGQPDVECVLSTVSFQAPELVLQLMEARSQGGVGGGGCGRGARDLLSLTVAEGEAIQVKRRRNCELHNKLYADLYYGQGSVNQSFKNRRLHQVSGRERCAQLCFDHLVQAMRGGGPSNSTTRHEDAPDGGRDQVDQMDLLDRLDPTSRLRELIEAHRRVKSNACRSFYYLEASNLAKLPIGIQNKVRDRVVQLPGDDLAAGYCLIGDRLDPAEAIELHKNGKLNTGYLPEYVSFEKFSFKFELLYEKQPDVSLRASHMGPNELVAYYDIEKHGRLAARQSYELMREFVLDRNENIQDQIFADEQKCALVCFSQSWGPWPACQSFDLVARTYADARLVVRCQLNSLSLREALLLDRTDLIVQEEGEEEAAGEAGRAGPASQQATRVEVWHFEPKPGFVAAAPRAERDRQLVAGELAALLDEQRGRLGPLAVLALALAGLAGGLLAGIKLAGSLVAGAAGPLGGSGRQHHGGGPAAPVDTRYLVQEEVVEFGGQTAAGGGAGAAAERPLALQDMR